MRTLKMPLTLRNLSRIIKWLDLDCDFSGHFRSKNGKYAGYKTSSHITSNPTYIMFLFTKHPNKTKGSQTMLTLEQLAPFPWTYNDEEGQPIIDANNKRVCDTDCLGWDEEKSISQQEARETAIQKAIAALPDLILACEANLKAWQDISCCSFMPNIDPPLRVSLTMSALAKVNTGESTKLFDTIALLEVAKMVVEWGTGDHYTTVFEGKMVKAARAAIAQTIANKKETWVVETLIGNSWENCWTDDDTPTTFPTFREAKEALEAHKQSISAAVERGDMLASSEQYRIREI